MNKTQEAFDKFRAGLDKLWSDLKQDADGDGVPDALARLDEIARKVKIFWGSLTPEQRAFIEAQVMRFLLRVDG